MTDDREHKWPTEGEDTEMGLEDLLREAAAGMDPVPASVARYASEAFTLSRLDQDLAELIDDSWVDAGALTRGDATRMLTFGSATGTGSRIEIDVTRTGRTFELTGRITPPGPGELRVVHRGGETFCPVDSRGRFSVEIPHVGSIKLHFHPRAAPEAPIVTHWVAIG
jgi:hypothetical protein